MATAAARPHHYHPSFCEENVYWLCSNLGTEADGWFAVFISNPAQQVYLWKQRAGADQEDGLVCWDYHVLALQRIASGETLVWDLDSTLPFPCAFGEWTQRALRLGSRCDDNRRFRVVPARQYVQHFASDRRHMLVDAPSISAEGRRGAWIAPPPPWPPIRAPAGQTNTLPLFLDMANSSKDGRDAPHGTVFGQEAFVRVFGHVGEHD